VRKKKRAFLPLINLECVKKKKKKKKKKEAAKRKTTTQSNTSLIA
jgi:hypothetical protein